MVQIGTIEYEAKVSNVAQAQANANDFAESNREMGQSANEAAGSAAFLGGVLSTTAEAEQDAAEEGEQADERFTLLGSTVLGLASSLGTLALQFLGISSVGGAVTGALSSVWGWLSGLTLSGIMGSVTGALSSFAGWLAAGSAGALAVGAAIGAIIGLFGVWILEITGVLDWIGSLGETLSVELPGWARDGLLAVIGLFAGPLAVIGGFIVGFIRVGFDEAFAKAGQVINIFFGAFKRTFGRMGNFATNVLNRIGAFFGNLKTWAINQLRALGRFALGIWSGIQSRASNAIGGIVGFFTDVKSRATEEMNQLVSDVEDIPGEITDLFGDLGEGMGNKFAQLWNAIIPNQVGLDPVTLPTVTIDAGPLGSADIGGQTVFGGVTFDLPQLQAGGVVGRTGVAEVHEGEVVGQPGALIEAAGMGDPSGGGGGDVNVDNITIRIDGGDFDPSDLSRSQIREMADRLVDAIGDKTNRRSGVR